MEKVIEVFYPQTKERRVKTVKQNQNPNRWAVSPEEQKRWEAQLRRGERTHQIRLAAKLIDDTLRDCRRA